MKYKLTHNHSCSELTSAAIKKRVTTVCSSNLFEVRHDDRTELRGVFTLRETERAENAEKGDEDLETKDGYEKLKHCAPKGNNATALDKHDLILSDSSVPNSLKAVVGSTFERRNTAEEAKVVVDNGHAGVGVDSREDATDIDTLSPLGTLWDSDQAEEVVDTDENGLQTREIVEGKEEDVECPKTSYGCEEGNGVVDEQEKITEYFQHSKMVAVLMSFIDGRQINAPGREVLLQLQYLSEGFGYDLTIRDSKYRDGMEEGRDEEENSKRILKRALLVCQKSDSIHQCPFSLIVFTVQSHVVSEEGCAEEALMENWRYACDVSKACHNHEPDARILRKLLPPSAQGEAMKMHNILRMGYADVLKYLEHRYHIRIDRETFRQHLK
ncbi:hypothetical protein BWQ96_08308 [Gracilariopsis chorda]|uniref:Uncharacterized protein n=1 Tax=Gracilariopsis chorda TaxID=448386 RepID=A0A2V3IIV2_9FLOR|nr:hypothetical protein BWQ96_08308 [Gracilariopsis chorda]|eukprot:PXF42001.1 hypothetical protein BWQ96_08308 [Gracilariopsis chorda]